MKNFLLCLIVAFISWLPAAAQKLHYSHRSTTTKGYGEKSSAQSTAAPSGVPKAHGASTSKELAKTEAQSNRLLAGSSQPAKSSAPKAPVVTSKAAKSDRNAPMNFQYRGQKTHTNSSGHAGTRGRKLR